MSVCSLIPKLREAQDRVSATLSSLGKDLRERLPQEGRLEAELKQTEQRLAGGAFNLALHRRQFRERVASVPIFLTIKSQYKERRATKSHGRFAEQLGEEIGRLAEQRQKQDAATRDAISDYLLDFSVQRPFEGNAPIITVIKQWVTENIELLEGNDLVRYRRQADEAAERESGRSRLFLGHSGHDALRTDRRTDDHGLVVGRTYLTIEHLPLLAHRRPSPTTAFGPKRSLGLIRTPVPAVVRSTDQHR